MTRTVLHRQNVACDGLGGDPVAWVKKQLQDWPDLPFRYLYAFATDGVAWGRIDEGALVTAPGGVALAPGPGRWLTEIRMFTDDLSTVAGESAGGAQVHAWHDGDDWRACLTRDGDLAGSSSVIPCDSIDETRLVAGTRAEAAGSGFTWLSEGQGLRHAVPLVLQDADFGPVWWRPVRLYVRHYVWVDGGSGVCGIRASRLGGLNVDRQTREAKG